MTTSKFEIINIISACESITIFTEYLDKMTMHLKNMISFIFKERLWTILLVIQLYFTILGHLSPVRTVVKILILKVHKPLIIK